MAVDAQLPLGDDDPLAVSITIALQRGDAHTLERMLAEHPGLARARIESTGSNRGSRTLLHVFADWPGNRPNPREVVSVLQRAGAELDAPFVGAHSETALHWAASNDDVALIDALLDAGADIEAPGSVISGGTPLMDAVVFGQWRAAERLLERGARTTFFQAAALGLTGQVGTALASSSPPSRDDVNAAFWAACHGGRRETAELLLQHGAEMNWIGWDDLTPLDVAERAGASDLIVRLKDHGARSHSELT